MDPRRDTSLVLSVPGWIDAAVADFSWPLETDEDRMALAVALSQLNIERGGGPFGAVVFAGTRVAAAGVNRVLDTGFSIAHAEIVAIMRAQQGRGGAGLPVGGGSGDEAERFSLVTTTEPCCQCFGAVVWSGIDRLVCGATTEDAEAIGFDEGPKPEAWPATLERRGIEVKLRVRRDEARAVLNEYARRGGPIYGLRSPRMP
jgi:tRNA(Arg) A34 adenosine deaminase TadA